MYENLHASFNSPYGCNRNPLTGSLWIIDGDGRADYLERKLPGWIKIMGPVYSNLEVDACNRLKEFFKNADVQVFVEAIAD